MRIVSLCPSVTELVFALGRGDWLVGRTRYCVLPADGVAGVPALGGTKTPSLDEILALEPDLVLLNEEENRLQDARALEAAGVAYLSSLPTDIAGAMAAVRTLGRALRAAEAAEEILRRIREEERRTRDEAEGQEPVPVAYLIWRKPWMAAGGHTYIDSLLRAAGGRNVFGDRVAGDPASGNRLVRYPEIRAEELAPAGVRAVLLSSEPFPFTEAHVEELADSSGLPAEHFVMVDGQALSWHGSHTADGLAYARRLLRRLRLDGGGPF